MAQYTRPDYKGWKVIINHHTGYGGNFMGYKVTNNKVADQVQAESYDKLKQLIDDKEAQQ